MGRDAGVTVDRETLAVYEHLAGTYAARGTVPDAERTAALVAEATARDDGRPGPVLDLGCGPGHHLPLLGSQIIGLDPAAAMLAEARSTAPGAPLVRAAAGALPFRPRSLGGAWASKCLQHIAAADLPLALADLHRALPVGAPLRATLFAGEGDRVSGGDLPGRRFTFWDPSALAELAEGAGFVAVRSRTEPVRSEEAARGRWTPVHLDATRGLTLADTIAPGMRLLVCGLNPSLHAAQVGVGYAGPGNRFWPALAEAGLLPPGADRDPWRLLADARIGMTDLVKRATPRADALTTAEYRAGVTRLDRLCALVAPETVVLVGLAGWRAAADRRAVVGWQARRLGPSAVYVMPSTSGLNAGTSRAALVEHLRAAANRAGDQSTSPPGPTEPSPGADA